MPIISAEPIQTNIYRVSFMVCQGLIENVVVSPDGLYSISYIKNGQMVTNTGRILNIVQNRACPNKSYLLFDCSRDMSSKRERIYFFQIQYIKDVTENDAYRIAVKHGFEGTVEDWLLSLKGDPGASTYELAVEAGFIGTIEEFLAAQKGDKGDPGLSAYEIAVKEGYTGTEAEWIAEMQRAFGLEDRVKNVEDSLKWVHGMEI